MRHYQRPLSIAQPVTYSLPRPFAAVDGKPIATLRSASPIEQPSREDRNASPSGCPPIVRPPEEALRLCSCLPAVPTAARGRTPDLRQRRDFRMPSALATIASQSNAGLEALRRWSIETAQEPLACASPLDLPPPPAEPDDPERPAVAALFFSRTFTPRSSYRPEVGQEVGGGAARPPMISATAAPPASAPGWRPPRS
jgi:hypothetical protein